MRLTAKQLTDAIVESLDAAATKDSDPTLALRSAWCLLCGRLDHHADYDRNARRIVDAIERRLPWIKGHMEEEARA